nr:helicase-primase primase subunit [Mastomys natalensis cytomegalovirus 3]WEG70035.1 helicase-primase primase subunit [Mastomys natalensis cytomegalovirus 3]WEG70175.1 helicase-primase primase subunit [Mastomys natalensis cytomegalovirus 3]WEG70735.1 helicase-primase primase subunit [Mastomys natalensis cytomegalovirus 3]
MTTVLFATEYDTPNIVVNMLANTPTDHYIYPLMVKYRPSNRVEFVLQTQKCPDSVRVQPVFICNARLLALSQYVTTCSPIPVNVIYTSLDSDATKEIYAHLFEPQESHNDTPIDDLKYLIHFNRNAILRYLNTTFMSPTSPSWFISTYGATEGTLILTMSYYLFERQYSTIQTTRDYTKCFTRDAGRPLFTYITMRDFISILHTSPFRKQVDRFASYAKAKNARDRRELEYVDQKINNFREESRLAADSCVYYVYLAYRTALRREKILKYCDYTEYHPDIADENQCTMEENFLGRSLDEELISVMDTYFSVEGYFGTYIQTHRVELHVPNTYRGYDWDTNSISMTGYSSTSTNVATAIRKLNSDCESLFSPLQTNISGLMKLCTSGRYIVRDDGSALSRRNYLLNDTSRTIGPTPVFRIEMPDNKHVFCTVRTENWKKRILPKDFIKNLPSEYVSDESLTDSIWFHENIAASNEVGEQLYRTRHELFNENLPVFNFIGDLDLKLREDVIGISKKDLFTLCRSLRKTMIDAWSHIFPQTDRLTHPVFFFKTACKTAQTTTIDDFEYQEQPTFCSCRQKLGMRIIIPVPSGTAIFGGHVLKRLAKILDHTISLDRNLVAQLNAISHPGECFDTGIYHHGRSIRMPLMYKTDESGLLLHGRLNPIFIVPEGRREQPAEFIMQHISPENLTHHSNPDNAPIREALISIEDKACKDTEYNFLQTQTKHTNSTKKLPLGPLLKTHLSGDPLPNSYYESATGDESTQDDECEDSTDDIQAFARNIAWPRVLEHTRGHYREEVYAQLQEATIFNAVGRNCVAVKRTSYGRVRDFRCLTRDHRTPQETVQVFIDIRGDLRQNVWVTLWSRCFTRKCHSNSKQTHVSVKIPAPSQY